MSKPALLAVCGVPEGLKARRLISKSSMDLFLFKLKFFFYVVVWKEISGNRANKAKSEEKYIPRWRSNIIVFPTYRFFAFDNLESDEWHQVSRLFFTMGTKKADWSTLIRLVNKPNYHRNFCKTLENFLIKSLSLNTTSTTITVRYTVW